MQCQRRLSLRQHTVTWLLSPPAGKLHAADLQTWQTAVADRPVACRRMHEELKATMQSGRLAAQAAAGVGESCMQCMTWCIVVPS